MILRFRPALLGALLVAFVPPLAAQSRDEGADALFRKLDRNGDGFLSPAELASQPAREGNWIAVDRDGDGRIARQEFGLVRNFAATPSTSGAGGTRAPQTAEKPKAEGQPSTAEGRP
jgi:Ca2+-binding EF-hand superfamily protein